MSAEINNMPKAVILLSTYNGSKYLREQLDSILNQKGVDVHIIVRDDGSSDGTVAIIERYVLCYPNIILIQGENIGCKRSFYELARYAFSRFSDISFFSFSDQDDVWLPNKLRTGIEALSKVGPNQYGLYFCHTQLVDSQLNKIGHASLHKHDLSFLNLCITYIASGCTMVFNREALDLFLKGKPEVMYLHDSWMIKAVSACGGYITEDPNSHILYRQHDRNVVGGSTSTFDRWKRRLSFVKKSKKQRSNELRAIRSTYEKSIAAQNLDMLNQFSTYSSNIKAKIRLLLSSKIRHVEDSSLFFKFSILFNLF